MKTKLKTLLESIQEDNSGKIQGGFIVIKHADNEFFIGGEDSNNCNGGNCYTGCGNNNYMGCSTGNKYNTVPGCGA